MTRVARAGHMRALGRARALAWRARPSPAGGRTGPPVRGQHADSHDVEALAGLLHPAANGADEDVGRVVGELRVIARLLHLAVELVIVLDREDGAVEGLDLLDVFVGDRPEDYGQLLLVLLLKRLPGRDDRVVLGREVVKRHARAGRSAPPRR